MGPSRARPQDDRRFPQGQRFPGYDRFCARFVELCRELGLLATASIAIDGSKFKAVNNRDKNFAKGKVERHRAQLEGSVARYLAQLDIDARPPCFAYLASNPNRPTTLFKLAPLDWGAACAMIAASKVRSDTPS